MTVSQTLACALSIFTAFLLGVLVPIHAGVEHGKQFEQQREQQRDCETAGHTYTYDTFNKGRCWLNGAVMHEEVDQ